MDPLSIVCSTSALVAQTAKVVKVLYELHGTLKDAPLLLSSIMTECTVVRTTLCALQDMQTQKSNRISLISEQIFNSFSMAVACCELILANLEQDTKTCLKAGKNAGDKDSVRRCKIILSKDHLQELLTQLRGQSQAIMSLFSIWQSRNEEQMRRHEEDNRDVLRGIARRVMRRYTESQSSSHESQSAASFDRFDFDQELLSADSYQRAMHYLRKMESRQTELRGPTPGPQIMGLGISLPPEEYDSPAPKSPCGPNPSLPRSQHEEDLTNMPETPTINVSFHLEDPPEPIFKEPSTSLAARSECIDETPNQNFFISKRRSMPPLYSQIQAVAMSPNALLGVVARAQRHRRSRSEGNEAMTASSPIKVTTPSANSLSFRDSAIFDSNYTSGTASKDDFNADFDEFWILQAYREHYRSSPIPVRKIVFLGDSSIRPLWSTIRATPRDLRDSGYDNENRKDYDLSVAIDDVNLDLHLVDMTGDHKDFAASLLEPEAHIAVIVYAIENPYSLRDVLHKWAIIVRDIYPMLPIYILGWGPEVRSNTPLINWLDSMGQKPVTYEDGAVIFHRLQAEAFLEVGAHNERDAVDLFEALAKTSVHLHHEELRGRTVNDFELERNRLSQASPLSFGAVQSPKFSILTGDVSRSCRTSLLHELDATPKTDLDECETKTESHIDDSPEQQESPKAFYTGVGSLDRDSDDFQASNYDSESFLDTQTEPEEDDAMVEQELDIAFPTDNLALSYRSETQQAKATMRAPVLLRIDTGLSEQHRPRLIEISRPQYKADDFQSNEEPELPDWETSLQRYFLLDPGCQDVPPGMTVEPSNCEDHSTYWTKNPRANDDNEIDILNSRSSTSEPKPSPYILPDLPEFEAFTPKLMDFFFETVLDDTKDFNS